MSKTRFDYQRLKKRITERFMTQKNFAIALNIGSSTLSLKLNNRSTFCEKDIDKAISLLDLKPENDDVKRYFFAKKV